MEQRAFGTTGLRVSAVGLGAGQVGERWVDERAAERLLNQALDLGITLIDTARDYGTSEERIGRYLARRREEFVLSTKVGHSVPGHRNFSYGAVKVGIEDARATLRSDVLDIVHLHSCSLEELKAGEAVEALEEARARGWVRVAAYSGDNGEPYWERWRAMSPDLRGLPADEVALRFTAFLPGLGSLIAGTSNPDNLTRNVEAVAHGPLDPDHVASLRASFAAADPGDWVALV
jgi:aryl-alcohol dehydrogenase-like predicted oxidoreductase